MFLTYSEDVFESILVVVVVLVTAELLSLEFLFAAGFSSIVSGSARVSLNLTESFSMRV